MKEFKVTILILREVLLFAPFSWSNAIVIWVNFKIFLNECITKLKVLKASHSIEAPDDPIVQSSWVSVGCWHVKIKHISFATDIGHKRYFRVEISQSFRRVTWKSTDIDKIIIIPKLIEFQGIHLKISFRQVSIELDTSALPFKETDHASLIRQFEFHMQVSVRVILLSVCKFEPNVIIIVLG